ncbi:MAG: hypothetical protein KC516_03045 [Nanoarchaeota archaeon]|nr:hypothetical protein [Nanoarchaeota archaeon]
MHGCHKGLWFLFGAFIVIFTFVSWAPAKWFIFGIGVILVLHGLAGDKSICHETCNHEEMPKKPMKKKSKK